MANVPPIRFTLFDGKQRAKTNYQLTALGKVKAEEFRITGPKGDVMSALESVGPATITEVASEAKIPPERVKQIVHRLVLEGWVSKVPGE